jgi:hypothetical protein
MMNHNNHAFSEMVFSPKTAGDFFVTVFIILSIILLWKENWYKISILWSNYKQDTLDTLTTYNIFVSNSDSQRLVLHAIVLSATVSVLGIYFLEMKLDHIPITIWTYFNALLLINFWHLAFIHKITVTIINIGLIVLMNRTRLPFNYILLLPPIFVGSALFLLTKIF